MSTLPADFTFEPKVWKDHVSAFFVRKLVWGLVALSDDTLVGEPGETVHMPFFDKIGDAEEPAADEALGVDKLTDNSFSATIKEIGKAVGVRRAALRKSAAKREKIFREVQMQIARVMAEKVDKDLAAEASLDANSDVGYLATAASETMDIRKIVQAKIAAFGDRHAEASAIFMHSLQYSTLFRDTTAGFLKADANDPLYKLPGFEGRISGMALITSDTVAEISGGIDGKKAYRALIVKPNPWGFLTAQEPDMEMDYDMLNREYLFGGTQWYAVKAFHKKVSTDDKRIARMDIPTEVAV